MSSPGVLSCVNSMLTVPPGPSAFASKRSLTRGSSTMCRAAGSLQARTGSLVQTRT